MRCSNVYLWSRGFCNNTLAGNERYLNGLLNSRRTLTGDTALIIRITGQSWASLVSFPAIKYGHICENDKEANG